ncbi:MAG TPA: maleylpyruvate isomerase N-terminal domain-containing protein [Chloroflexota bacterium]
MSSEEQRYEEALQLPVAPADIRDAVLAELQRTGDTVQRVSLEDWTRQSAVPDWRVGDVVAHLNLALGVYGRLMDLVVSGRTGSGILRKAGQFTKNIAPVAAPAFNALNSAIPKVLDRALSPEVIKGQFAAGARTLREKLDRVGPNDYMKPVYYMGGPWPLSFFLTAVVNELAIHGWDITSQLEPEAHLSSEARSLLPWFYWTATSWMFHPSKDMQGTIAVSLRDPNAEMWWSVAGTAVETGNGAPENADVTIRGQSGIFPLVLAGRISAEDALRTTSLTTEGNEELARQFLSKWKIV